MRMSADGLRDGGGSGLRCWRRWRRRPPIVEVKIDNFVFSPERLTVKAGTTVTWINHDDIPHTVAAKDRAFKSKVMDTDESFSFTFSTPGEYFYFCSLHPHMTGTIVVEGTTGSGASQ